MLIRNNEITVYRGETWTLSKNIVNRDGSPYIVSSRFNNPFWLITVSSSRYSQTNRYILNKWLNLKDAKRFDITTPVDYKSIDPSYSFANPVLPDGYEGDETSGYANKAIFYEKDTNGVTSYKYWEYNNNEEGDWSGKFVDYKCNIVTSFNRDTTSKWIEQNYVYEILLVDGERTEDRLISIYDKYKENFANNSVESVEDMYNRLENFDENLVKDLDLNRPIVINVNYPILNPTKLSVKSLLNKPV